MHWKIGHISLFKIRNKAKQNPEEKTSKQVSSRIHTCTHREKAMKKIVHIKYTYKLHLT